MQSTMPEKEYLLAQQADKEVDRSRYINQFQRQQWPAERKDKSCSMLIYHGKAAQPCSWNR